MYKDWTNDHKCHYRHYGHTAFSYETMIYQDIGTMTIGNVTRYGHTTTRHQNKANVYQCDIRLDDVPEGCSSLLDLAIERGLVTLTLTLNKGETE